MTGKAGDWTRTNKRRKKNGWIGKRTTQTKTHKEHVTPHTHGLTINTRNYTIRLHVYKQRIIAAWIEKQLCSVCLTECSRRKISIMSCWSCSCSPMLMGNIGKALDTIRHCEIEKKEEGHHNKFIPVEDALKIAENVDKELVANLISKHKHALNTSRREMLQKQKPGEIQAAVDRVVLVQTVDGRSGTGIVIKRPNWFKKDEIAVMTNYHVVHNDTDNNSNNDKDNDIDNDNGEESGLDDQYHDLGKIDPVTIGVFFFLDSKSSKEKWTYVGGRVTEISPVASKDSDEKMPEYEQRRDKQRLDFVILSVKIESDEDLEKMTKRCLIKGKSSDGTLKYDFLGFEETARVQAQADLWPHREGAREAHGLIISHPHGCCKYISFGNLTSDVLLLRTEWNESNEEETTNEMDKNRKGHIEVTHNIPTCKGSSGSPVIMIDPLCQLTITKFLFLHFCGQEYPTNVGVRLNTRDIKSMTDDEWLDDEFDCQDERAISSYEALNLAGSKSTSKSLLSQNDVSFLKMHGQDKLKCLAKMVVLIGAESKTQSQIYGTGILVDRRIGFDHKSQNKFAVLTSYKLLEDVDADKIDVVLFNPEKRETKEHYMKVQYIKPWPLRGGQTDGLYLLLDLKEQESLAGLKYFEQKDYGANTTLVCDELSSCHFPDNTPMEKRICQAESRNIVVVGHPKGSQTHFSFGHLISSAADLQDHQKPLVYSASTFPGSCGSAVFMITNCLRHKKTANESVYSVKFLGLHLGQRHENQGGRAVSLQSILPEVRSQIPKKNTTTRRRIEKL